MADMTSDLQKLADDVEAGGLPYTAKRLRAIAARLQTQEPPPLPQDAASAWGSTGSAGRSEVTDRMRSQVEIERELRRCRRALKARNISFDSELYGVQQALCWVLGQNAMAPVKFATLPTAATQTAGRDKT